MQGAENCANKNQKNRINLSLHISVFSSAQHHTYHEIYCHRVWVQFKSNYLSSSKRKAINMGPPGGAVRASVGSLVGMPQSVLVERSQGDKALGAQRAREGALACVASAVDVQLGATPEEPLTPVTPKPLRCPTVPDMRPPAYLCPRSEGGGDCCGEASTRGPCTLLAMPDAFKNQLRYLLVGMKQVSKQISESFCRNLPGREGNRPFFWQVEKYHGCWNKKEEGKEAVLSSP